MKNKPCTLASVPLEKNWSLLTAEEMAFSELEQDEFFSFMVKDQIPLYINKSLEYGERLAKECIPPSMKVTDIINEVIKKKISIRFIDKDPMDTWVRAQYIRKPATVRIYKSSIKQLQDFFYSMDTPVTEEDIIALHLFHEWFHYLEEKKYGRTDHLLPKVIIKKTGLFPHKRRITKTREIAAHHFTQKALKLPWSPLLLDYILLYNQKGVSLLNLREKFQDLKERYQKITELDETGMEIE